MQKISRKASQNEHLQMAIFNITIDCAFKEWWRYNIITVCEACREDGERVSFASQESIIADIGAELSEQPDIYPDDRTLRFTTEEADYVNLLIYVIPHTSPRAEFLDTAQPFPVTVEVASDNKIILRKECEINQWAGENISLLNIGKEQ